MKVLLENEEPLALINFCLDECQEPDCVGTDGCYAYQVKRAQLFGKPIPAEPKRGPYKTKEKPLALPEAKKPKREPCKSEEKPLILANFEEPEIVAGHAEEPCKAACATKEQQALMLINAAIEALDKALDVIPNDKWDTAYIDAPHRLRQYRSEAYAHLVDWNAIAGGGLTPPKAGGV